MDIREAASRAERRVSVALVHADLIYPNPVSTAVYNWASFRSRQSASISDQKRRGLRIPDRYDITEHPGGDAIEEVVWGQETER